MEKSNKNTLLKILVPVIMVVVIAVIWFMQSGNSQDNTAVNSGDFALEVTSINLDELKEHKLPMIIDFGADECEPCKAMAPVLVDVNKDMEGKALIKFVDVWKNPEASTDFPVQLIPTQIFVNADGSPYVPDESLEIDFITYVDRETEEHVFTAHQGALTEEQMNLILADMGV